MIQKNSTIYLFLAFVVTGIYLFISALDHERRKEYFMQNQFYVILLGLSTTISIVVLFPIKKDKSICYWQIDIILNLILLGLFVYRSLNLSGSSCF
jgi:Ca2+/Na+ antiporter